MEHSFREAPFIYARKRVTRALEGTEMLNQKPPVYFCTIKSSMCEIGKLRPSGNSIQPPDPASHEGTVFFVTSSSYIKPGTVLASLDVAWNRLIQLFIIIIIKQGSEQIVSPE